MLLFFLFFLVGRLTCSKLRNGKLQKFKTFFVHSVVFLSYFWQTTPTLNFSSQLMIIFSMRISLHILTLIWFEGPL